jgi:phosphonate transport system permease protein
MVIASIIRNVPFMVWATLLIFTFGIGNVVGLLAISLVTLGFLSRSYAVSLDEIDSEKLDGLRAAGASIATKSRCQ